MFGVSLDRLGVARNSLSSRMMRSSLSIRESPTSCATCAGAGGVAFWASISAGKNANNNAVKMFLKNPPTLHTAKTLEYFSNGISTANLILAGKRGQLRQLLARCPRGDHKTCESRCFAKIVSHTRGDKRRRRIDNHDIAPGPRFVFQDAFDNRRIFSSSS